MNCILYSKSKGAIARLAAFPADVLHEEGEILIPCEADADVDDAERWREEAAFMLENGYIAPTLELAKAVKKDELMRMRDALVAGGFPHKGRVFPIGPDIQVTMLVQFIGSQSMSGNHYAWKDVGGDYVDIGDAATFQEFMVRAMMFGQSFFSWEEMLQELVHKAESIEAVQAIAWDTVPDGPV